MSSSMRRSNVLKDAPRKPLPGIKSSKPISGMKTNKPLPPGKPGKASKPVPSRSSSRLQQPPQSIHGVRLEPLKTAGSPLLVKHKRVVSGSTNAVSPHDDADVTKSFIFSGGNSATAEDNVLRRTYAVSEHNTHLSVINEVKHKRVVSGSTNAVSPHDDADITKSYIFSGGNSATAEDNVLRRTYAVSEHNTHLSVINESCEGGISVDVTLETEENKQQIDQCEDVVRGGGGGGIRDRKRSSSKLPDDTNGGNAVVRKRSSVRLSQVEDCNYRRDECDTGRVEGHEELSHSLASERLKHSKWMRAASVQKLTGNNSVATAAAAAQSRKPCVFYEKGKCINGVNCRYRHSEWLCRNNLSGHCPYGENCRFSHSTHTDERRTILDEASNCETAEDLSDVEGNQKDERHSENLNQPIETDMKVLDEIYAGMVHSCCDVRAHVINVENGLRTVRKSYFRIVMRRSSYQNEFKAGQIHEEAIVDYRDFYDSAETYLLSFKRALGHSLLGELSLQNEEIISVCQYAERVIRTRHTNWKVDPQAMTCALNDERNRQEVLSYFATIEKEVLLFKNLLSLTASVSSSNVPPISSLLPLKPL